MTKRFKKLLSALCIIALLVSSIATVFANGDPEAELPAVQETAAEANVTDNTEAAAAPAAAEEAPAQETAPAAAEEAPAQETAPAAAEEAPAQETAPVVVEEVPAQETAPVTVEGALAQETAPATAEEAPAQETTPVTTEEAPTQETALATVEETPAQETAPVTTEEAPAQETAPVTTEETPAQETAPVTMEEASAEETALATTEETPAQETAPETVEETPDQGTVPETVEETPAQETVPETVEETPAQNDGSAAKTAPAQEGAADLNAAPVQEDTAPAEENNANSDESVVTEENTPADGIDELANEPANYSEDELVELEDNGGYIDPEFIAEYFPEITPEMKYENITEMKVGSTISGSAGVDEILYYIKAARTQNIILVLETNGNIQVRINERAVSFIDNEDGTKSYEMKVQYDQTYIIGISGQGVFKLSTEVKVVEEAEEIEETEEEVDEEIEETSEEIETVDEQTDTTDAETETAAEIAENSETNDNAENSDELNDESTETVDEATNEGTETPAETSETVITEAEQTEVENTENTQAAIAETVENKAEEETESIENTVPVEEKPVETSKPKINTWVTANNNEEEGTVTVYANADIELDNQIVWQTRSADSEEWKKAGYGLKLTVEVTEENANNFFRFKLADGEFSPEYQIHATVKAAEEETEEVIEEIPAETEAEEEATVSEENEEETASYESTEEEAEVAVAEEVAETETIVSEEEVVTVEGTEEAAAETEAIEEVTETEVTEEAEAKEETAEETEEVVAETEVTEEEAEAEGETAEETEAAEEEIEEEEAEPLTEEQLIELGYRKIQILNQNGTNLYDSTIEEATVIGTAETGAELWIKDTEVEGWAEIYTEDEVQKFLKPAETEKQPLTEKQLIELGYRKIQILNQNGVDFYDGTKEEAAVTGHADFESELWIKDTEAEGWAEIYTGDDILQYILLADIEKQMLSDEEMLEMGYIKVYAAIDIGANVYGSIDGDDVVAHLDVGTELWVKLIEAAERAFIFDLDENTPSRYINLVDIIATLKPEGMEKLPTREIVIHSNMDGTILNVLFVGTKIELTAELVNFTEDDQYEVSWQYSPDGEEYKEIEDANDLEFSYVVDTENGNYFWKVIVKLITARE